MFDKTILKYTQSPLMSIAHTLKRHHIHADHVTLIGFLIGMTALPLIATGHSEWALISIILNRLCDGLDGTLARLGEPSDRGGFLDIVLDFLFYSSIPLGFALANPIENALAASVLIYSFIGTGCSFLAFAIIAEKRKMGSTDYPDKSFYYLGGLTEASETILVFVLMCSLPSFFTWLAYGFAALCLITTGLRIHAGWMLFK